MDGVFLVGGWISDNVNLGGSVDIDWVSVFGMGFSCGEIGVVVVDTSWGARVAFCSLVTDLDVADCFSASILDWSAYFLRFNSTFSFTSLASEPIKKEFNLPEVWEIASLTLFLYSASLSFSGFL